jgi:hypothetical protein
LEKCVRARPVNGKGTSRLDPIADDHDDPLSARGDAEAVERVRALHPSAPAPDAFALSDAQLVIASWPQLERKIDSLTPVARSDFGIIARSFLRYPAAVRLLDAALHSLSKESSSCDH